MTYTRKEIENRIEELETRKFYLDMVDRWTPEDYQYNRELCAEILSWKGLLK
jgi:phage terminase large subunit